MAYFTAISGLLGLAKGVGKAATGLPAFGGKPPRRRRRKGLTLRQKQDLVFVKDQIGRTAAAAYLSLLKT